LNKQFIAVAGNIGAGKSTLVTRLSRRLKAKPYFEPVEENPYLVDFYKDMERWAFQSQVFFLSYRMRSHNELLHESSPVVQDRSVYEDAEIFAKNLFNQGQMSNRDYETYRNLYELFVDLLDPPHLVIYLKAPVDVLKKRIAKRGREFETGITTEYLQRLGRLYDEWIADFSLCPVLTVPASRMDFASVDAYVDVIAHEVNRITDGKQETLFELEDLTWRARTPGEGHPVDDE
jgi:deoxyadenosine/deoxycytidine kinase